MDQSSISIHAQRWSATVLNVETTCRTAELLQRLTDDDYVASTECIDAMQLLVNPQASAVTAITVQTAAEAGRRATLEVAVAEFASAFFEIPPDQRQQKWQTLHDDCQAVPQLTHWLKHLERALHLPHVPEMHDELGDVFVNLCCRSFVARDPERARRRQAIFHMYCHKPTSWQSIVTNLQTSHDEFVTAVVPWLPQLHPLFLAELDEDCNWALPAVAVGTRSAEDDNSWWPWPILAVIIGFVMFAIGLNTPRSSTSTSEQMRSTKSQPHLPDIRWGLKVEDAKDNPELLRAARLATKILLGEFEPNESPDATARENSESITELPADALKPDQPDSDSNHKPGS